MSKKTPSFNRKLILEERINQGKKIEGLKGFVPAETKCCSGRTTAYIPVEIVGIKLGTECSFSIRVKAVTDEVLVRSNKEDTFLTSPQNFFQSSEEIEKWETYLKKVAKFEEEMAPFKYNRGGTITSKRRKFKAALDEAPAVLKGEIEADYSDKDEGFKSMSADWINENYKRLMLAKYFPEYADVSGFDPDESEDWEEE